ncbi:MAG: hypothetical protein EXS46_01790 [Candidatus Taylorbacteria bacterium]|nr:hypothetical protein [Candidatus Taylorbacteria bacterium]
MKKYIIGSSVATTLTVFAQSAFAQAALINVKPATFDSSGLGGLIVAVNRIVNYIVPFLVGLAVLVVIYGVFGFISNAADEEARASAKQFIIWGIIGIFIMLSVWGLVTILEGTLVLTKDASGIKTPTVSTTIVP